MHAKTAAHTSLPPNEVAILKANKKVALQGACGGSGAPKQQRIFDLV